MQIVHIIITFFLMSLASVKVNRYFGGKNKITKN